MGIFVHCHVIYVATVVCCTLLFLLRVKIAGPLPPSHQQNDHDR